MALKEEAHSGRLCFQNSSTKEEKGQSKRGLSYAPKQIFYVARHMEKSK